MAKYANLHKYHTTHNFDVGDVVTLGSERRYDVTQVSDMDGGWVRVWLQEPVIGAQEIRGRWVSATHPKLAKVER